jgi:mxaK protein
VKRRTMHRGFAIVAALCAVVALVQAVRMVRLARVNEALASMPVVLLGTASPPSEPPRVTLARALAIAKTGDVDHAIKEYSRLITTSGEDTVSRTALYDLGNLYLRRGVALSEHDTVAALPYIELAKQRYRDLLRVDPQEWDARYNLERALRLAPESQSVFSHQARQGEQRQSMAPHDDVAAPDMP